MHQGACDDSLTRVELENRAHTSAWRVSLAFVDSGTVETLEIPVGAETIPSRVKV